MKTRTFVSTEIECDDITFILTGIYSVLDLDLL